MWFQIRQFVLLLTTITGLVTFILPILNALFLTIPFPILVHARGKERNSFTVVSGGRWLDFSCDMARLMIKPADVSERPGANTISVVLAYCSEYMY